MFCSKLNCGTRNNKSTDAYGCNNVYCSSRECKTYHNVEQYIKNQDCETIKNQEKQ